MKLLIYWHDIFLPYSDYLVRAFSTDKRISELCVVGPKEYSADSIYAGSKNANDYPPNIFFKKIETYSFRKKWGPISEFKRCIKEFQPDCIIVLDEAFSINVLNMGIANALAANQATLLFYGFENIIQTPPWKFLIENISLKNLYIFLRKTLRYIFVDFLLQPIRSRVVSGGLVCYRESLEVVHQFGWFPKLKEQWWGLELDSFSSCKKSQVTFNEQVAELVGKPLVLAKDQGSKVIGYVGRLIPEKGVLDLLDLIYKLGPSYHLLIVGSGPLKDLIRQKIEMSSLADRVTLIPPLVREDLVILYQFLDVLILPSKTDYFWKEQYGRVLIESMACGTPVVGSQSGAIPYVVGNPSACFPEGDIAAMASVVENSLSTSGNPQLVDSLKKRAQLGDVHRFLDAFIDLHLEICPNKGYFG